LLFLKVALLEEFFEKQVGPFFNDREVSRLLADIAGMNAHLHDLLLV
jgi:hypothetical protein